MREYDVREGGATRPLPSSCGGRGFFVEIYKMHPVAYGLREGALTLTYNFIVVARGLVRNLVRPTEIGVRVLVAQGDSVLLVRHRGGREPWNLPGGGISAFETLEDAARREVHEESHCSVQVADLLGIYHSFSEGMSNYITVFVATPLGPACPPMADLEIVDARFFDPRDIPANTSPGALRRIEEYRQGRRGIYRPW